jgi:hypothetical protein
MSWKQKSYVLIFMLFIGLAMTSMQAGATSPRYMKLQYKPNTLTVTILHFSPITKIHYVYKVDIENNGELVKSQIYQSQPRFFFFTYTYNINASTSDVLTVTAYCSLFGKLTRSITVT